MTDTDAQVEVVYAKHGCAMANAQLLEDYLGHAVLAASPSVGRHFRTEECKVRSLSFARLTRRLKEQVPVPPSFDLRLQAARRQRNALAHGYFSRWAASFQTAAGRSEMINELDRIGEEFYQLWGILDSALVTWLGRMEPTTEDFTEDFRNATLGPNQRL
jgi:hypothetical protein